MQGAQTLTEVLAPLILQGGVPLKAVATLGRIIELDACLLDFRGGLMKGTSLEELDINFERYDGLVQRAGTGVDDFSKNRNALALIRLLLRIKDDLAANL